jgi:hypothetical protein
MLSTKRSGHDSKLIPQPCVPYSLEIEQPQILRQPPSPPLVLLQQKSYHYSPWTDRHHLASKMYTLSCDLAYNIYVSMVALSPTFRGIPSVRYMTTQLDKYCAIVTKSYARPHISTPYRTNTRSCDYHIFKR